MSLTTLVDVLRSPTYPLSVSLARLSVHRVGDYRRHHSACYPRLSSKWCVCEFLSCLCASVGPWT